MIPNQWHIYPSQTHMVSFEESDWTRTWESSDAEANTLGLSNNNHNKLNNSPQLN